MKEFTIAITYTSFSLIWAILLTILCFIKKPVKEPCIMSWIVFIAMFTFIFICERQNTKIKEKNDLEMKRWKQELEEIQRSYKK